MTTGNGSHSRLSRRRFLKVAGAAGAAFALPTFIPATALGRGGRPAPSERITVGIVGWGMIAPDNTQGLMALKDCQVVASCNIDKSHLKQSLDVINGFYQNKDCKSYHDYRKMLARDDLDAVMIAVPDHWHELIAVAAARRKKDIYGEKPLAKTIAEQQRIVQAVRENGCIWQTGSWQRSKGSFHKAAEIVRNGLIGKISRVEVGLPSGHTDFAHIEPEFVKKLAALNAGITSPAQVLPGTAAWNLAVTKAPRELDYNTWIGPSRMEPYIKVRGHLDWRWNYNTGGGQLMDWVGHHVDIAHWGLGFDSSGPYELEGHGDFPPQEAIWNTCTKYRIELKYPNDIRMTIAGGHDDIKNGTKWIGSDGWVWVNRESFDASNEDWRDIKELSDRDAKIKLIKSTDHYRNFIDSVKSRQPTITPVETAHHSTLPGHLGLISMWVGRKLRWDAAREEILDDPTATDLMTRMYRPPYEM
ncbi:MAG: Gfo/Idh/MocA family oxidoreductase [Verrucomicrobiota bacterium]|jgi:predicted dehydrogenase